MVITPRMLPPNPSERMITEAWWQWLQYKYPDVAKGTFHPPNEAKRTPTTCRILKRSGMTKGVSDFIMLWPSAGFHGAVFEFKSKTGKLTPEQATFLEHCKACGYFVDVFRDIDRAMDITSRYITDTLDEY